MHVSSGSVMNGKPRLQMDCLRIFGGVEARCLALHPCQPVVAVVPLMLSFDTSIIHNMKQDRNDDLLHVPYLLLKPAYWVLSNISVH